MRPVSVAALASLVLLIATTATCCAQEPATASAATPAAGPAAKNATMPSPKMLPAKTVDIILDEKGFNRTEFPARPAVVNNVINMVPGEKIFVEGDLLNNKLTNLRHVDSMDHPEKTIELEFKQNQDPKSPHMVLSIKNPFNKTMTYEAGVQYVGKDAILKTSTLPVHAKLVNYESWPQPINRIFMKRFYLVKSESAPEPVPAQPPAP